MEAKITKITWNKDGRTIRNGSGVNIILAVDNRSIIITSTLLVTPDQVGTDGIYSCEV